MSEIQSVDRQLCIKFPTSIVISRSVFESRAINFCFENNLSKFIILPLTFLNNSLLLSSNMLQNIKKYISSSTSCWHLLHIIWSCGVTDIEQLYVNNRTAICHVYLYVMYIFSQISVNQRQLPYEQVDSGP